MNVGYNQGGGSSLDGLPDVLTPADVQRVLGVGKNKACELLQQGHLKGWKIGSRWKIAKSALITYIQRAERNDGERLDHAA